MWRNYTDVEIADHFNMPQFQLNGHMTGVVKVKLRPGTTAVSSCTLSRETIRVLPDSNICPLHYARCGELGQFLAGPTAVEARISLGVTTILTIVTQTYGKP